MLRVLRADEQMEIYETSFRGRDVEPELNIRKDKLGVGQPPGRLMPQHLLVRVGDVVVCDRDRLNERYPRRPPPASGRMELSEGPGCPRTCANRQADRGS